MYVCKKCGETYHGNFGKCAKCGGDIVIDQNQAPPTLPQSPDGIGNPPQMDMIFLTNPWTHETATVGVGFSMWVLFLGFFYMAYKGSWKWAIVSFFAAFVSFGLSWFFFAFVFNKLHAKDLINKGFRPANAMSDILLKQNGIYVPFP